MKCTIGLTSEFIKKPPSYTAKLELFYGMTNSWIFGYANPTEDILWVFVDEIVFYNRTIRKIMKEISNTTIHELIHLCGVEDEATTEYGEKLIRVK